MKSIKSLLFLSLPAALAACSASPDGAPQGNENALLDHAKITTEGPVPALTRTITHSMGTVTLIPASQGFCYITSFAGDLDSQLERVRLDIDGNGNWNVAVDDVKPDFTNQITATVACSNFGNFTPVNRGSISPKASAYARLDCVWNGGIGCTDEEVGNPIVSLPSSSESCFLTGFGGMFNGPGEDATIFAGSLEVDNSDDQSNEDTLGDARCVGFATDSGGLAKPQVTVNRSLTEGSTPVDLMPVSQGVCFVTAVTGQFRGQGDAIAILPNPATGNWQMSVKSGSPGLGFTAQCIPFNQGLTAIRGVNAGATPDRQIHVRWSVDPGSTSTSWTVQTSSGVSVPVTTNPNLFNTYETVLRGTLTDQVRVCTALAASTDCSAWTSPKDATAPEWYDITDPDALQTGWGNGLSNGPWTVPWAQASRVAYAFCQGVGFVGGQLNGWWGGTGGNYGVVCYGDNAAFENTFDEVNPNVTSWNFSDANTIGWAFAARAAADICVKENPGSMGGWFNGNEFRGTMGLVCHHAPTQWFDSTTAQLSIIAGESRGFIGTTPGITLDDVSWDLAARVADRWCQDCTNFGWCPAANGKHFVSGRFNGYYSATNLGLTCY